jgi:hypothetical protein
MNLPSRELYPYCSIIISTGFDEHHCMKGTDFCAKEFDVKWNINELSKSKLKR